MRARMSTFATVACQMLSGQAVDGAAVKGTDPMTKETLEVVGSNPVCAGGLYQHVAVPRVVAGCAAATTGRWQQ